MSSLTLQFLVVFSVYLGSLQGTVLEEGDSCNREDGSTGVCRKMEFCASAIEQLQQYRILPDHCSFIVKEPIVCCSEPLSRITVDPEIERARAKTKEMCERYTAWSESTRAPPLSLQATPTPLATRGNHGRQLIFNFRRRRSETPDANVVTTYILGGHRVDNRTFPHMAAVGFGTEDDIAWQCGGSLVSETFVLTAAHCLYNKGSGTANWVQVGDLYLDSNFASPHRQLLRVVGRIPHPDYKPPALYNDIGLLRLEKAVTFTLFAHPACLHTEAVLDGNCTATGWGISNLTTGETSKYLMEVDLPVQNTSACNSTYEPLRVGGRKLVHGILDESMICVGEINGVKDTCKGDSGGPIQVSVTSSSTMYSILGVTSFGTSCGPASAPAIYMRVSYYVPWISATVWGDSQGDV